MRYTCYMTKTLLTLFICLSYLYSSAQRSEKIIFDAKYKQFDSLIEGDTLFFDYAFTNTSSIDFKIENIAATCGCTTPYYSKTPVKPNETGVIKVAFDTKDRVGENSKGVNLSTNFGDIHLVFTAIVMSKKKEDIPEEELLNLEE